MAIKEPLKPHHDSPATIQPDQFAESGSGLRGSLLNEIVALTQDILKLSNRDDVVRAVLRKASELLNAPHAVVNLIAPHGETMVVLVGFGVFDQNKYLESRKGEGLVGHIWETGQPLVLADYSTWAARRQFSELPPLRAAIGVPIKLAGNVIGVMGLAHIDATGVFLPEHLEVLKHLSELAASAVGSIEREQYLRAERDAAAALSQSMNESLRIARGEVNQHIQRLNRQNALLAALNETTVNLLKHTDLEPLLMGVMDHAKALTGAKRAFVAMVKEDGSAMLDVSSSVRENNWLIESKRGEGVKGKVWETGKTIVVDNYAEWPGRMQDPDLAHLRAMAVAPLMAGNQVTGCIGITDVDPAVRYGPEEIEILNRLAEIASLVCDRTRLLASERRNRQVAEGLTDVLKVVNSNRSLSDVLKHILEQSTDLLGSEIGIIFRLDTDRRILTITAACGVANADVSKFSVTVPKESLDRAKAYQEKNLVLPKRLARELIAKVQRNAHWRQILGPAIDALDGGIVAQLAVDGTIVGGMLIASKQKRSYSAEDRQVLQALATHASLAIQGTRLRVQSIELAAQEERARLARELHDSVSQALFGIALGINTAITMSQTDPESIAEPLSYALSLSQAAIAEMRTLIYQLQPDLIEKHGLRDILEMQATALRNRHQIAVTLEGDLEEPPLRIDLKEALYRAVSEALHNVVKHARAINVHLITTRAQHAYTISIVDNGVGFDTASAPPSSFGLRMMRERMEQFNGSVLITSAQGCGTSVVISIPFV